MTTIPLPAGAILRPLELPARADAGPTPKIREYAAVRNASLREQTGRDDHHQTAESLLPMLRSDVDMRRRQWSIEHGERIIGCLAFTILQDDGATTAIGAIALLTAHGGQGIGSAVLSFAEAQARQAGVRRLLSWHEHRGEPGAGALLSPTGSGSVPRDRAARFLERHGFTLEQVTRVSELRWSDDTDARLEALQHDAQQHATGYRIVQWMLPTPDDRIDGYAWLKSRMSTDVPDAELGMPAEVWDADRVRRHDERYVVRGSRVQVTAAEHSGTGELCAFNELAIVGPDTAKTDQEDTLVLSDHRCHRLGMLVKTAGLRAWHERFPHSSRVVTYNAEENRPMLSINEAIGFTPIAYEGAWKKELT